MNNKKIVAGLMALTLVFGGTALPNTVVSSAETVITGQTVTMEADCYSFDLDTGVLTLRGEVDGDALREFGCRQIVKFVIAEEGTVFPEDCSNLFGEYMDCITIDLSKADTSNVTNMSGMFSTRNHYVCPRRLNYIDLSGFNTSNVTDMSGMFDGCSGLNTLDLSSFDTSNVTNMSDMFIGCSDLTSIDLSSFDTSNVISMGYMFSGCSNLTSIDLGNFVTNNVIDMGRMFSDCKSMTTLDLSNFDTSNVIYMDGMFSDCYSMTTLDFSRFDTSNVTNMRGMFEGCSNLTTLDLSNLDTGNVTDMYGMFDGCKKLTTLDLSSFDTGNVTDMSGMFEHCENLTSLDLSGFNTSKVTDIAGMFWGCNNLTSLDLSNFDTGNVTDMRGMFRGCENLRKITLGENFKSIKLNAHLPNGDGWVNVNDPSTIVSNGEFTNIYAAIENEGNNTYVRYFRYTPTNIKVEYSEKYHQVRFTWDKVEKAEQYGVAVYLAGKWRVQAQNITDTTYTTPKNLTPGKTYKVAIAAKVDGKWYTSSAIETAFNVTVK